MALVTLVSAFYGLGIVLVRKLGAGLAAWAIQAWIAFVAAPTLLVSAAFFEGGHGAAAQAAHWGVWLFIVFGAVVSSIVANAFVLKTGAEIASLAHEPYLLLTPVISFALAVLSVHDTISLPILGGRALTMSGVALAALAEQRFKAIA